MYVVVSDDCSCSHESDAALERAGGREEREKVAGGLASECVCNTREKRECGRKIRTDVSYKKLLYYLCMGVSQAILSRSRDIVS